MTSLFRAKRNFDVSDDKAFDDKKRKRILSASEEEDSRGAFSSSKYCSDLPMSKIYNSSFRNNKPAELFRKDLISAMKLPDTDQLMPDDYWVISDTWKPEWERGVQVPVNPSAMPTAVIRCSRKKEKSDFKLPKKYLKCTYDKFFSNEVHVMSTAVTQAEKVCRYDLDDVDVEWLKVLNEELEYYGLSPIDEASVELIIEEFESESFNNYQKSRKKDGIEFDEDVICDVCRSPDTEEGNEMVFCDSCNICVHQACYGITSIPEGSWLCCTCALGTEPPCLLCPYRGGAMKSTRNGQKWAHVSCALWIPEVTIGCVERMEPITKISMIPVSRWQLVCSLCKEKSGACIQCSVKTCKIAYHVTCAFEHGLEMKAIIAETEEDGIKLKSFCRKHSKQKDNSSESDSEPSPRKKRRIKRELNMSSGDKKTEESTRYVASEFFSGISISSVAELLKIELQIVEFVFQYWKLKRKANFNRPLLMPKVEELNVLGRNDEDYAKMKMFVHLRQDLERAKAISSLRNIHNEQITKLQTKHQQDVDFLEDIRNFSKLRAAIEKEYGQALLKLSTTYLQKKLPNISETKSCSAEDQKIVYTVWKSLLDETEKIAKARLAAAEVYQQQVSESAKVLRANKIQLAKKCFDNVRKMQEEIQPCIQELDKTKKLYFEEEHMAHEAREKAHDAEEKLKKKKGRIFQSISSLQKTSTKFSFRKEACDIQATKARNDYILALVAANAHQSKYYTIDLPAVLQLLDCDIYEKVREYIQLISRTELLTSAACQASFTVVQDQAQMITRQYTLECFLEDNPVLAKIVQYAFDPCDNDKLDKISTEYNAGVYLTKDAKKWATCIAKETRTLCNSWKEINRLQAQFNEADKTVEAGEQAETRIEIENKIDELKQIIRRAETSKLKAEARIEALREGEVNVDEYIRTDTDSLGPYETGDNLSRTGTVSSRGSRKSSQAEQTTDDVTSEVNDSFYESDIANSTVSDTPEIPAVCPTTIEDVTAAWEEVPPISEPIDAADYSESTVTEEDNEIINPLPIRCIALFNYQATNQDELSFVEQEELEIVSEGDGDGWIKARNYLGEEGFVPQNYVEIEDGQHLESSIQPAPASFSSVDYYIPESSAEVPPSVPEETEYVVETALPEVEPTVAASEAKKEEKALYCQALYDYQATCDDELSFCEGQMILILRKIVHDVDDGWWEGEINGKVGLFPSLVVEEIRSDEGSICSQDAISPMDSAPPPAYTPPKPQFVLLPAQVILTQPTPEIEEYKEGESTAKAVSVLYNDPDFQLEMPEGQQAQYQTQFSASDNDSEVSEQEVVAVEEELGKYAPLVSSPESPTHGQAKGAEKEETVETEQVIITKPDKVQIPTVEISIAPDESPPDEDAVDHTKNTYRSAEELDFDVEMDVPVDDSVKDIVSSDEKLQDKTSAEDSASSCQSKEENKTEARQTSIADSYNRVKETVLNGTLAECDSVLDQEDSNTTDDLKFTCEFVKSEDKSQVECKK